MRKAVGKEERWDWGAWVEEKAEWSGHVQGYLFDEPVLSNTEK